jgi:hypothetical protein
MTLAEINRRIQVSDPLVTLHRGQGYHYYEFDNMSIKAPDDRLVYETASVMVPFLKQQPADVWIADALEFASRVREENDL